MSQTFSKEALTYLTSALSPSVVETRQQGGRSLSYIPAYQIKAALTRVFGFGGWNWTLVSVDVKSPNLAVVHGRLEVPAYGIVYDGVGAGESKVSADALDMAVKTADSEALKRAASNLGTAFGLGLYANGSLADVVKTTYNKEQMEALRGDAD